MNHQISDGAPEVGLDEGHRVAARFAEISERLHQGVSETVTARRVAECAAEVVPGCEESGVLLRGHRGSLLPAAHTGPEVAAVDESQCVLVEGPCFDPGLDLGLDPALDRGPRLEPDLERGEAWPNWSAVAVGHGLRSVLALPLRLDGEDLGALTLYARRRAAFDERSIAWASVFAAHAAQALRHLRTVTGLRAALESRHDIGIAQGVVAVRYDVSYEEAFAVLHRYSNESNTKLRDLARQVKQERSLPARPS